MEGKILIVGNPLLDMSTDADEALLKKYNLKPGNAIMAEDEHKPLYEELKKEHKVEYIAGGAAQNTARVAQWMIGISKSVSYAGCVGKDEFGNRLEEEAKKDGVNVHYLKTETHSTGTCACLITNKERSLVANLAAAEQYKIDHIKSDEMKPIIEKAQIFYLSAFFLTHSFESALYLAKHAAEHNKIFAMNLAAPFLSEVPPFLERLLKILPYCDYIIGNESEGAAIGKVKDWGNKGEDLVSVGKALQSFEKVNDKRPRIALITQGAGDTILIQSNDNVSKHPVDPKVPEDEIVDVNGAGDAFVGGFLAGIAQDKDLTTSLKAGFYAADEIIRRSGCKYPAEPKFKF